MGSEHEDNEAFEQATREGPTRHQQYLAGTLTADDWTDEELARGMLKGRDGKFHGKPTKVVPTELLLKQQSTLRQRAQARLEAAVFAAVDHVAAVTRGDEDPNPDRLRAANVILDRVLGKAADRVDVTVTAAPAWTGIFSSIYRELPARPVEEVVEAEVVEP